MCGSPLSQISTAPGTPDVSFLLDSTSLDTGHFIPCQDMFDLDEMEACTELLKNSPANVCPTSAKNSPAIELVPDDALIHVLSLVTEVSSISNLSPVCQRVSTLVKSESVWKGRVVHIPCAGLVNFMPELNTWTNSWRQASKLVVPNSPELIAKIVQRAPELKVDVAWRFDPELKGSGVLTCNGGRSVRRALGAKDDLVALGDAPLPTRVGHDGGPKPYLEVVLDDRSGKDFDGLNDFGIGITTRRPTKKQVGSVADEVPLSWVVDFTKHAVMLTVNNFEVAKGLKMSGEFLEEGDRVGLLFTPEGTVKLYINGKLEDHLIPSETQRVPKDAELFPVFDLYGCTLQLSRTYADSPFEV